MGFNRNIPVYKLTGGRIYLRKEDIVYYLQQNRLMSSKEIELESINYLVNGATKRKAGRISGSILKNK